MTTTGLTHQIHLPPRLSNDDAVVKLAVDLGLKVTAEGIETEEQKRFLSQIGCTDVQGYHFSRPVRSERIREHIEAARRQSKDGLPAAGLRMGAA